MIFVFISYHGQAQVGRGFNTNSDLLVENLSAPSITSERGVYDFLTSSTSNPRDIVIDDELRKNCMSAKAKYRDHCKQKKKEEKIMK